MTNDLGPGFCGTCGDTFTTTAALNAHQAETGHEMDQPDHPLRGLAALPTSSVPAAFDRGHLYSPTLSLTRLALDARYLYDYRPGDLYEPMPEAPRGDGKAFAWWWENTARLDAPDYLGLTVGDEITIQHANGPGPGMVLETWRYGAVVRYPYPLPGRSGEMVVRRRNDAGHWYP